jgi:hypothetical protein
MSSAIPPIEPSTLSSISDPNSISNLIKRTEEQNKQATSDTKYDTKKGVYESFVASQGSTRQVSIITSLAIAAGILFLIGGILPKKRTS